MIIVCKFANFTCCGQCCDGTNIFGHASLFCTNSGFGISGGHRSPHFANRTDFFKYQKKFGRLEEYVCIPTREDGTAINDVEDGIRRLLDIRMSEGALSDWWEGQKRKEGGRDCADLVTDALREGGAKNTSCWARRLSSLFVLTPNSCIAFAEALALDMCNSGGISFDNYDKLLKTAGEVGGVNKFKGPGGSCWPF